MLQASSRLMGGYALGGHADDLTRRSRTFSVLSRLMCWSGWCETGLRMRIAVRSVREANGRNQTGYSGDCSTKWDKPGLDGDLDC